MNANLEPFISQFREFIRLSEPLGLSPPPSAVASDFQQFVDESKPLIVGPIRSALVAVAPRLSLARRWLTSHDLLRVAGVKRLEDPYTELIRWALNPDTHPASAIVRQQAWLDVLPLGTALRVHEPATPKTQVWTQDGVPDLILQYDQFVVVVEAKTASDEHETPSGAMQTFAYSDAVREVLDLDPAKSIHVVFLTPDRRKAANPEAINTTFVEFSLSLASALENISLPDDARFAYSMLFTHLLTWAVPPGIDTLAAIGRLDEWLGQLGNDDFLLSNLNEIGALITLFAGGSFDERIQGIQ